jgi:hypothetical protein
MGDNFYSSTNYTEYTDSVPSSFFQNCRQKIAQIILTSLLALTLANIFHFCSSIFTFDMIYFIRGGLNSFPEEQQIAENGEPFLG